MKTIKQGTIKRIVVNRHKIRSGDAKPLSIQTSKGPVAASHILVTGPSAIVFRPERPLKCGAKVWVATKAEVKYHD